mgnify:CR=1 FL=1
MTNANRVRTWNPAKGDALQGDVCLFKLPDSIKIDTSDEIASKDHRLILAEGEITGHHHAIWLRNPPVMFRDDAIAREIEATASVPTATARLYRDPKAIDALVRAGELTTAALAIGLLVVEGDYMTLTHDEHDAIRIPPGRYYVGGQQEWDSAQARRVAD